MSKNTSEVILKPSSLLQDLGFDKVLELCASFSVGAEAASLIKKTIPDFHAEKIRLELMQCHQVLELLSHSNIQLDPYTDVSDELDLLRIENYVLRTEEILAIRIILENLDAIRVLLRFQEWQHLDLLQTLINRSPDLTLVIKAIHKVMAPDGTIRDEASDELKLIRRRITGKKNEVYKVFKKILAQQRNSGILAEGEESIRNGRLVLRVLQEHRKKVEGIIHDESDTGKTLFIEPKELVEINNEIFELEAEEKKEIFRILSELCSLIRPFRKEIKISYTHLNEWDVLTSKARFCEQLDAVVPAVVEDDRHELIFARHPLLHLKFKAEHKKVVPSDIRLSKDARILLISGPNAGGKTVVLKTAGLIQCMLQSGFPVPVHKNSKVRIFKKIFGDIGDHQSLEDDLSTYSARLKNMRDFEIEADENTLVLIDELGSGTEPVIGGAIAEALLDSLNKKRSYGLLNTHFSNLKVYAHQHPGMLNAAMIFDEKNLRPTYRLEIGRPGGSFALEIAEKIKLPSHLLRYAQKKAGQQAVNFEKLLSSLDLENQKLQKQMEEYHQKRAELDKLIRTYQDLQKQNEYKRLKLKLEQKQLDLQMSLSKQKEIEKFAKELRKEKELQSILQKAEAEKQKIKEKTENILNLHEQIHGEKESATQEPLKIGDSVKLVLSGMTGKVSGIEKDKISVVTENMTFRLKRNEIVKIKDLIQMRPERSVKSDVELSGKPFQPVLDLRGMRLQEAQEMLDQFIDKALLSNVNRVHVVHGIGNGILKKTVAKSLKNQSYVKSLSHPEEEMGGQSVTIVEFS